MPVGGPPLTHRHDRDHGDGEGLLVAAAAAARCCLGPAMRPARLVLLDGDALAGRARQPADLLVQPVDVVIVGAVQEARNPCLHCVGTQQPGEPELHGGES